MKTLIGKEHTVTRQLLDEVKHDIMILMQGIKQGFIIHDIMWKLNSIIVLLYIFLNNMQKKTLST